MGFLGLCLLFAGMALIMNGAAVISKRDARSAAFINPVTGGILVIGNLIGIAKADGAGRPLAGRLPAAFAWQAKARRRLSRRHSGGDICHRRVRRADVIRLAEIAR
ncbi:MAG: hypothetical protein LBP23_00095 [Treponema sp.]|jgi:hypothetical protein|nr:hypothetical protein [Treponema sp.]